MRSKFTPLKLTLIFVLFTQVLSAQNNYRSSGAGSGNWHDPASWQEEISPGNWQATANAPDENDGVISILSGHTITVAAGFSRTADQIVVDAGGTLTVNDVLTLNDGTGTDLQVNGTLNQISTITGVSTVSLIVAGTYNWNGGTLAATTTINAGGILNVQNNDKNLNTTITNNGTTNWSASTITFNLGVFNNDGVFNATANNTMAFGSLVNAFNNNATGVFTKSTGTGNTVFNIPVTNAGTININTGNIVSGTANGSFTNSGSVNFTSGTSLSLQGTAAGGNDFNMGSAVTGTGTLNINGPTDVNLALSIPSTVLFNLNAPTYTLGGVGPLTINGTATWTNGNLDVPTTLAAGSSLAINGGTLSLTGPLTNDGTINWNSGNFAFNNGTLTNNDDFNILGNGFITSGGGVNLITNSSTGNISKSTGTGVTEVFVSITNTGTLNINTGALGIRGNSTFTNSGTINFSGTTLTIGYNASATGNFNAGTVFTGVATLENRFSSTTNINVPLTVANLVMTTGSVSGTGSITVTDYLSWEATALNIDATLSAGAVGILRGGNAGGRTLAADFTNNGTIDWKAHPINFSNASLTNNGIISASDTTGGTAVFALNSSGGTNTFVNAGILRKTTNNTLTNNLGVAFTNTGRIEGSGTYSFAAGTLTNNGIVSPGTNFFPENPPIYTPAILTINNQAITANGTVEIEVYTSTTPGTGHDQLAISTGGVTPLSGTLRIVDHMGAPVGTYVILTTAGTFSGTFTTLDIPANFSAPDYSVANQVSITKLAVVPLPVIWGTFTATPNHNKVDLKWTTLEERNAAHFIVEHSVDGINYNNIGRVEAIGNSNSTNHYELVHAAPNRNKLNYYRILQVDIDNKKQYSVIRTARFGNEKPIIVETMPNPVRNTLQMLVQAEDITIVLSDMNGRILRTMKLSEGAHQLDMQALAKGVYNLTIYQKDSRLETRRIVKD